MLDLDKVEKEFNERKKDNLSQFALEIIPQLINELKQTRIEVLDALLKSK